jgi:hypothetical protein
MRTEEVVNSNGKVGKKIQFWAINGPFRMLYLSPYLHIYLRTYAPTTAN